MMTFKIEYFLKNIDIVDLCKVSLCIKFFIQYNTGSCCVHIACHVYIYIYLFVCLLVACVLYVFVCVFVCVTLN